MTEQSQFALLGKKRFLPFFVTQLLGAFNDNIFKQSLILAILYHLTVAGDRNLLVNLCALLFILPFFLFSALGGQFGEKFNKDALMRPDLKPGPVRLINMIRLGDALNMPDAGVGGPPVKALVVYNSNPAAVAPDRNAVVRGLAREDLFTVVLEHFQTDTADWADWLLPATTQLEHWDLHFSYGHLYATLNQPSNLPKPSRSPVPYHATWPGRLPRSPAGSTRRRGRRR